MSKWINWILFACAVTSVMYVGLLLILRGNWLIGETLGLTSYVIGMYICLIKPHWIKESDEN